MSSDRPEQPIKWLLNELRSILSDDQYTSLMKDYTVVKRRYDLAGRLRLAKQELALFRRNQSQYEPGTTRYQAYAVKIARRMERVKTLIEALEQEISEL